MIYAQLSRSIVARMVATSASIGGGDSFAQAYPAKAIRVIDAYPPGGVRWPR